MAIFAALAGCTPYPSLYDALASSAKTHGAVNPFVGLWEELEVNGLRVDYNSRRFRAMYKFTDDGRWESYTVNPANGAITLNHSHDSRGAYSYRGPVLYMRHLAYGGVVVYHQIAYGPTYSTSIWRLDGDELRLDGAPKKYATVLRRAPAD